MPHLGIVIIEGGQEEAEAAGGQLGQLGHAGALQNGAKCKGGCLSTPPILGPPLLVDVILGTLNTTHFSPPTDMCCAQPGVSWPASLAPDVKFWHART